MLYLAGSASRAVYAEWEKKKPQPVCFGYAVTVETNSNRPVRAWIWLMRIGAMTGCHQMHERSLFFRGYQFPVCARCTGLFIGQITGIALFMLLLNFNIKLLLLCTVFSAALLGIDGFFQLKKIWVSTNFRRLFTGTLCGFFVTVFFIRIIIMLINYIWQSA
jgi:uncharacterized membrane protein